MMPHPIQELEPPANTARFGFVPLSCPDPQRRAKQAHRSAQLSITTLARLLWLQRAERLNLEGLPLFCRVLALIGRFGSLIAQCGLTHQLEQAHVAGRVGYVIAHDHGFYRGFQANLGSGRGDPGAGAKSTGARRGCHVRGKVWCRNARGNIWKNARDWQSRRPERH